VDFALFLLVNLLLFVRPVELLPVLEGLDIYLYLIVACLLVSLPNFARHAERHSPWRQPSTLCVLGMVPAVVLSHLARFDLWSAHVGGWNFLKTATYYLLLIVVVNTVSRLRTLLFCTALFTTLSAAVGILHYYGQIEVPALSVLEERRIDEITGEVTAIPRLRATGIFNDPNDLAMIATVSVVICAYGLFDRTLGVFRIVWLAPLATLVWTVVLTQSRGGLLAFCAAGATFLLVRLGASMALILGLALAALAGALFGGRQTEVWVAMSGGTGATRVQLWSEGLQLLKSSPLVGIGFGKYAESAGQVAHNSFLHCLAELGLLGGTLFLGAHWFAFAALWRFVMGPSARLGRRLAPTRLSTLAAPILAMLAGSGVSQLALSRAYVVSTYSVLGAAGAYALLLSHTVPGCAFELNGRRLAGLALLAIAFLASVYVLVRLVAR